MIKNYKRFYESYHDLETGEVEISKTQLTLVFAAIEIYIAYGKMTDKEKPLYTKEDVQLLLHERTITKNLKPIAFQACIFLDFIINDTPNEYLDPLGTFYIKTDDHGAVIKVQHPVDRKWILNDDLLLELPKLIELLR